MSQITTIPLEDQVLAILRARRVASFRWCESEDIALQLDRPKSEIVLRLHALYESGNVSRISDSVGTQYRVSPDGERTQGCCCCCNEKLIPSDKLFCQTCGPEFSGRV